MEQRREGQREARENSKPETNGNKKTTDQEWNVVALLWRNQAGNKKTAMTMLALQKTKMYRNSAYLRWVRRLPCAFPGCWIEEASDAHHIKGVGHMSGCGLTAPDYMTMPLCREHHIIMQKTPEYWPLQWEMVARTLGRAIDERILI